MNLAEEMVAVVANLQQREWIQGRERDGERVCAHGAVMTCEGLRPGDQWIIRAVMRTKGVTENWNDTRGRTKQEVVARMALIDITDDELAATFGPTWRLVIAVIRRAATLSADEAALLAAAGAAALAAALAAAGDAARAAARDAALAAAGDAARDAALAAAGAAARAAAWDAAGDAARDAARAVADLVGQHGLTQKHIDTLMGPWVSVLGEVPTHG